MCVGMFVDCSRRICCGQTVGHHTTTTGSENPEFAGRSNDRGAAPVYVLYLQDGVKISP